MPGQQAGGCTHLGIGPCRYKGRPAQNRRPLFAVLSWEDWQAVQAALEDRADAAAVAGFEARRAAWRRPCPAVLVPPSLSRRLAGA